MKGYKLTFPMKVKRVANAWVLGLPKEYVDVMELSEGEWVIATIERLGQED